MCTFLYPCRPDTFVFSKGEQLEVAMRVVNHGEDAYQAKVYLPQPPGLQYTIVQSRDNISAVSCSPRHQGTKTTLICDIGNPLKMHTGVCIYQCVIVNYMTTNKHTHKTTFSVTQNLLEHIHALPSSLFPSLVLSPL